MFNHSIIMIKISGFPIAFIHRYTLYGKYPIYQHIFFITCGVSICLWNFGNYLSLTNSIEY